MDTSMREKERKIWWHSCRETRRAWLHAYGWCFSVEAVPFSRSCHLSFGIKEHEDTVSFSLAVPFIFALYLGIQMPWGSKAGKLLPPPGRFNFAIHHWSIWLTLWGNEWGDWSRDKPWWKNGVNFDIPRFFLGDTRHVREILREEPVVIQLDGYSYEGTARLERSVWWRPRKFAKSRDSVWIEMKPGHGLPHSGKGENSWDCGDDAICGWGINGSDIQAAIEDGIRRVGEYRKKYGKPSSYAPVDVKPNERAMSDCGSAVSTA